MWWERAFTFIQVRQEYVCICSIRLNRAMAKIITFHVAAKGLSSTWLKTIGWFLHRSLLIVVFTAECIALPLKAKTVWLPNQTSTQWGIMKLWTRILMCLTFFVFALSRLAAVILWRIGKVSRFVTIGKVLSQIMQSSSPGTSKKPMSKDSASS